MSNKNFDTCASFYLDGGRFVGRLVRLDGVLNTILDKHQYPINVSTALAETTALSVLLSAALKYDGLFTLQIQGNGPISLLVTDVTSENKIRACARFDAQKLEAAKALRKTEDLIEELPHLVGGGYMAFTIDQGDRTNLYQGIVDLQGNNLTEMALRYFKQSEQIDTALKLFVKRPEGESRTWQAAGLLLQKAPIKGGNTQTEDPTEQNLIWEDLQAFVASLSENEVFDADLDDENILNRLFHAHNLTIGQEKHYTFGCRCSREKVRQTLQTFAPEEVRQMVENGHITATCHFCSEEYVFEPEECLNSPVLKH